MARRICIVFSGGMYHFTTGQIVANAQRCGASEAPWIFDDYWLKHYRPEFIRKHQDLFQKTDDRGNLKGHGWFVWKSYTLIDALTRCNDGDCVLYIDADTIPISDMTPLYETIDKEGMMFFKSVGHVQRMWCKRQCMHLMGVDSDEFRNKEHACARFVGVKKGAPGQEAVSGDDDAAGRRGVAQRSDGEN